MDHRKRLDWAGKQLNALHEAIGVMANSQPCAFTTQFDTETAEYFVRIKDVTPYPEDWNLQVGDIVHNIRASLDNATYALAVKHSGVLSHGDMVKIQFPICDTEAGFRHPQKGQRARRLYKLSSDAQAAIELFQPYTRPDKSRTSILAVLRDLSNIDKHRHILLTSSVAMNTSMELRGPGIQPGTMIQTYRGPLIPGTVVANWRFDPPILHPKVKMKFKYTFDVDFPEGTPGELNSVYLLLHAMIEHIAEDVLPPLEALM